jgi:hypothetical protein
MVSDKELLVQAIEKYVTGTASSLFGISSMPAQALIRYAVRNAAEKYGKVLDLFVDKDGKINTDLMFDAVHAELKARNGFTFMNIRFSEDDIQEIKNILTQLRVNNHAQQD